MKYYLNYNQIFNNAQGSSFNEQNLKVKDNARAELENLMREYNMPLDEYERDRRCNR